MLELAGTSLDLNFTLYNLTFEGVWRFDDHDHDNATLLNFDLLRTLEVRTEVQALSSLPLDPPKYQPGFFWDDFNKVSTDFVPVVKVIDNSIKIIRAALIL